MCEEIRFGHPEHKGVELSEDDEVFVEKGRVGARAAAIAACLQGVDPE